MKGRHRRRARRRRGATTTPHFRNLRLSVASPCTWRRRRRANGRLRRRARATSRTCRRCHYAARPTPSRLRSSPTENAPAAARSTTSAARHPAGRARPGGGLGINTNRRDAGGVLGLRAERVGQPREHDGGHAPVLAALRELCAGGRAAQGGGRRRGGRARALGGAARSSSAQCSSKNTRSRASPSTPSCCRTTARRWPPRSAARRSRARRRVDFALRFGRRVRLRHAHRRRRARLLGSRAPRRELRGGGRADAIAAAAHAAPPLGRRRLRPRDRGAPARPRRLRDHLGADARGAGREGRGRSGSRAAPKVDNFQSILLHGSP